MESQDDTTCPDGFDPDRVAALIEDGPGPAGDWRHVEACRVCARLYFEFLMVDRAVAGVIRDRQPTRLEPPAEPRRRGRLFRLRPVGAAAAAILLLAGVTTGAMYVIRPSWFVTTGPSNPDRAGDLARYMGLDLEGSGISPAAPVLDRIPVLQGDTQPGLVVALRADLQGGVDLLGFAGDGRRLWNCRTWEDWSMTLAARRVGDVQLTLHTTRFDETRLEDTLVLLAQQGDVAGLLLISPEDGARRGMIYFDGQIARGEYDLPGVAVLPAGRGVDRNFVAAIRIGRGEAARAGVLVFNKSGQVLQALELPGIDYPRAREVKAVSLRVDWFEESPSVWVLTSEDLRFEFPVRQGHLVVDQARVSFTRGLDRDYDTNRGEGAFRRLDFAQIAREVKSIELPALSGWRKHW